MSSDANAAQAHGGPAEPPAYKYDAFISYSFATDYPRARKLESFLESFHKSTKSAPAAVHPMKICRDGSDFVLHRKQRELLSSETAPGTAAQNDKDLVWEIILRELSKAKYLIVLCSPGAVKSTYVPREVGWFIKNRGAEWVLPVVTEAEDPKAHPEQCFPRALIEEDIHESRIWYDLRGADPKPGARGVRDHDDERVRLAGDLLEWDADKHGVLSAVWQREQFKRRRRQASAVLVVAALIVALAGYSYVKARAAQKSAAEAESAAQARDAANSEKEQALGREKGALTRAQEEQLAREVATKEREEAVAAKEEESKLKLAAIEREKKAAEKARQESSRARQEAIRAAHFNIDLSLLNDKPDDNKPYDFERREKLSGLMSVATETGYEKAQATIGRRLGCLPPPSVRTELLPADASLSRALINHDGKRLALVHKDRLEILDAETMRPLYPPTPLPAANAKRLSALTDPYGDRIFVGIGQEDAPAGGGEVGNFLLRRERDLDYYVTTFDGGPLTRLSVTRETVADIVTGFGLSWRQASFIKALASMTDERGAVVPPSKLLEGVRVRHALTNLSRPVLLEYDRRTKTGLYEILTFAEQPGGGNKAVPATRRLIVEGPDTGAVDLVKSEPVSFLVNEGPNLNIRMQEPGGRRPSPHTSVTYLDGRSRVALIGQRYFRFSGGVTLYRLKSMVRKLTPGPIGVYRFDFTPDADFVLVRWLGSVSLFDVTRNEVKHAFLSDGDVVRFTASGQPQFLNADEQGLIAWDLSAFGPNGWPQPDCPPDESNKETDEEAGEEN